MLGAALQPAPSTAPPGDAGDPAANASFRTLAIETLCDLMRRGQPSDGRRQAATTALRYLSQLDRLAHLDRIAAQRRPHAAESPAPSSPPAYPPQLVSPPTPQSTSPQSPPPHAPASLPSRAELNQLLEAVRDTAATTHPNDSRPVFFPAAIDSLPSLITAPLAIESDPRIDPACLPLGITIPSRDPAHLRALATDSPRTQRPASLITAAGTAPSG